MRQPITAGSTSRSIRVGIYEVLLVRTSDRVNASLRQEVDAFRQLSRGVDPNSGRPFGDDLGASSPSAASATSPARARS